MFLTMNLVFDHEKLKVYQAAIRFVAWADALLETLPKNLAHENPGNYKATGDNASMDQEQD